eukprot:6598069-Pyramimonas_sp.AAC.1
MYMRSDKVATALKADLGATSQTIFQRLYSQTHPGEKTRLVSKLHANPPGDRRAVRTLEKGEVIGPTVGPAVRCETIYGDFASAP